MRGAGALGIVSSTLGSGPPIDNFDPVLTGNIQGEHAVLPQTSTIFTGTTSLSPEHQYLQLRVHAGFFLRNIVECDVQQQLRNHELAVRPGHATAYAQRSASS